MASIKDVARRANVSTSTVSHVINGTRFVSDEVKKKVNDAMEELNYVPNVLALSLRTKCTKTIGVILPVSNDENSNIFIMKILLGADSVFSKNGYTVIISNTHDIIAEEQSAVYNMITRQIDGLLIVPTDGNHQFMNEIMEKKSCVFIDRIPSDLPEADYVVSQSEEGMKEAMLAMIGRGYRRTGILCAPRGKFGNSELRLKGCLAAMEESGLIIDENLICECESSVEDGYKKAKYLIETQNIDSIITVSNIMGMGVVKCLKEKGMKIPQELGLTIFDDYAWNDIYTPGICAVRQNPLEIGRRGAELLLQKMAAKESENWTPQQILLPTELMIRESWK